MTAGSDGDAGAIQRTLESMLERMDRQDAEIAKLQGRVDALGLRVIALENPEAAMDRAHRGLAEATACLPAYAEHLTQAEVAERACKKD